MKRKKRLLSLLLSLAVCLGTFPAAVYAEEGDAGNSTDSPSELVYDGVTYFDGQSQHFEDSTRLFIQDLLSAKNTNLDDESTASLWQYLGYAIQKANGAGTSDSKFKTQFGQVLYDGLAISTGDVSQYSKDDVKDDDEDNKYDVRSSGLRYASSVAAAAQSMEDQIFIDYRNAGGGREEKYPKSNQTDEDAAIKHNEDLAARDSESDTFWMMTGAYKTSGTNKKGHYQVLGVIFSDFSVTPIVPEYNEDYFQTTVSEPVAGGMNKLSDVRNETTATVTATQGLDTTYTTTFTSEINGSNSYTYGGSVGLSGGGGYEFGIAGNKANWHIEGSISACFSNSIEEGWSESQSTTEQMSEHSDVAVTLPPYTNVMLEQTESETTTTTKYDCAVALNFNVTFVEYTLDPSSNNARCATKKLATFEGTAREDLYQRGVVEKTLIDENYINWQTLFKNNSGLEDKVKSLATTAPMSNTGASFEIKEDSMINKVDGLIACLPLDRVSLVYQMPTLNLMPGTPYYVNNIELTGYNRENGEYYGFNKLNGKWILLDENGNETTNSNVAKLITDPVSGYTRLEAGTEDGTVYLKYIIDEDCYNSAEAQEHYTTNSELSRTAIVEVHVTNTQDTFNAGYIYVDGELSGIVGDEPKSIEGSDGLSVRMEDLTGKEVSYPVEWEAKELNGITVEAGMVSFSEPGTYHVRARCGDVISEWVEVTALPARALDSILIPDSYEMYVSAGNALDLNNIQVQTFDQYGDAFDSESEITWTCGSGAGTIDEENILTVPSAGTYVLKASAGGITSNSMTVTVMDDTVKAMKWVFENGITTSGTAEEFNGTDVCSRAQAMTFIWRAAGSPAPEGSDMIFEDVADDAYYRDAVLWAVEKGITSGTSDTTFSPDKVCTRAEIVSFLWRYEGTPKVLTENQFDDVEQGAYYENSVKWADFFCITRGTAENLFSPDKACTREQMVTFLYRLFK